MHAQQNIPYIEMHTHYKIYPRMKCTHTTKYTLD